MNSLSNFDHFENPLEAYLTHMGKNAVEPNFVNVLVRSETYQFTLPNKKCIVSVKPNQIIIQRLNFDYDNISKYSPQTVDGAKELIGILSGVFFEHGCNREQSNNLTYYIYKIFSEMSFGMPA